MSRYLNYVGAETQAVPEESEQPEDVRPAAKRRPAPKG